LRSLMVDHINNTRNFALDHPLLLLNVISTHLVRAEAEALIIMNNINADNDATERHQEDDSP